MRRALAGLTLQPCHALIDGRDVPPNLIWSGLPCPGSALVKGDQRSVSIAAASIVAKVTRDRLMRRMHASFPHYGFDSHVGYATRAHIEAIRVHGQCAIHRVSFAPFKPLPLFEANT